MNHEELSPAKLQDHLLRGLEGRVDPEELKGFVRKATAVGTPSPIQAKASIIHVVIYGNVTCEPSGQHWKWDESIWGLGAAGGSSLGFIYTAYDSWDAFFNNTNGFHVQGIADAGGILQINWFKGATPIGQFNGAMAGAGGIEGGGKGHWKHK